jgi:hypothetical protein
MFLVEVLLLARCVFASLETGKELHTRLVEGVEAYMYSRANVHFRIVNFLIAFVTRNRGSVANT